MEKRKGRGVSTKGLYCCDFETTSKAQYDIEGFTKVYFYKLVSLDNKYKKYGLTIEERFKDVSENKDISTIYFHNLTFDGSFIVDFLLRENYKFNKESKTLKKGEFNAIIDMFNKIYQITIFVNERPLKIACSYMLTTLSIDNLGKLLGIPKLKEIHDYLGIKNYATLEDVPKDEFLYIDNDVEIMRLGILECFRLGIRGMTKSSACFKIWKNLNYAKIQDKCMQEETEEIKTIVDKSYRGGITQVNKKYQDMILKDMRNYDVNSLYPSVMYQDMPNEVGYIAPSDNLIPNNYSIRLYQIYVFRATIKEDYIPFIPTIKSFVFNHSYDYPSKIEDLELCIWGNEFELFKLYYDVDFKISKVIGWKPLKNMFTDYLEKFRLMKENAPNPSAERDFAKRCMNSLYGKLAQSEVLTSKEPYYNPFSDEVDFAPYTTEGKSYDKKVASYITSQARVVLIKAINKCPSRFVYCDTDSIYVLGDYEYDIPIDDRKFGYWKYEHSYDKFKCLKAKCYIATIKGSGEVHSAIAGLPKEIQQTLTFDNFKNGLVIYNAKKQLHRVKGGIIIVNAPFTIKVEEDRLTSSLAINLRN